MKSLQLWCLLAQQYNHLFYFFYKQEKGLWAQNLVAKCSSTHQSTHVGAINYIHETLIKINEQNKSIILISTDTDELLKLSDKISVINKGKLSKIMNAEEVTLEKLGILMGGGEID